MAKGQKRGNRELKKPKQKKKVTPAPGAFIVAPPRLNGGTVPKKS